MSSFINYERVGEFNVQKLVSAADQLEVIFLYVVVVIGRL